jgi:hypothetical protein
MKKFISLLLIAFMMSQAFAVNEAKASETSHWFTVKPNPTAAGESAEYHIFGGVSNYNNIDTLRVVFQWDTTFLYANYVQSSAVTVNGAPALAVSFNQIENKQIEATITLSKVVNSGDSIDILFSKDAGIINPTTPRPCFTVNVYLVSRGVELDSVGSDQYAITQSIVTIKNVSIDLPVKGAATAYTIGFVTGVNGLINANTDYIKVKFPDGTGIPTTLNKTYVLVNGIKPTDIYRDVNISNTILIYPSVQIEDKSQVVLSFLKGFGLFNPAQAGMYTISVSTYTEYDWVESAPFAIVSPQVQNLSVSLQDNAIAAVSSWDINFSTSLVGYLQKGSQVYIEFPQGFMLPQTIDSSQISVNGVNTTTTINHNVLSITNPSDIYNGKDVDVTISQNANIKNPISPSDYNIAVYTDSDAAKAIYSVKIIPSTLKDVNLSAKYSGTGSTNNFSITFKTGPAYTLIGGTDTINIKFDDKFILPDTISSTSVLINDKEATNVTSNVHEIIATVPIDLPPASLVTVKITENANIKNPTDTGAYSVYVSTSKESVPIASNAISIIPLPVVEFSVTPSTPDGDNGFYKKSPTVQLTSNGKDVYYKIDDKDFTLYGMPFSISDGNHTIYAYAVDASGNKGDTVGKTVNIDSSPPKIYFEGGMSDIYVNSTNATITGKVSEPCVLQIGGVVVKVNDDLSFTVNLNVHDGMAVAIYMRDLAGNAVSMLITAHVDSTPPIIQLINPNSITYETSAQSITIEFKVSKQCTVAVNLNSVESANGIYSYPSALSDGENMFAIVAKDLAGNVATQNIVVKKVNQTQIKLVIGNKTAYIGSNETVLDAAPFIEKGFTFVPLRFIAEAFGATLNYNSALKVINISYKGVSIQLQVGSTIAIVDSVAKTLEVAPKIVNSRTFVPVRFISETFGADVQWEQATQTITIVYKF